MTAIIEAIRTVVTHEIAKLHLLELGVVTSVFPHSGESDKDNYECNLRLRDKEVELRKVPIATQHIGLSNAVHVNDLVLVSFINGDINSPMVIGRLYNDEDRPPLSKMEEIVYKPPYSKKDDLKRLNIVLPEGTVNITLNDNAISVVVGKSSIRADSTGKISIHSISSSNSKESQVIIDGDTMKIKSDIPLKISSKEDIEIESNKKITLKGNDISLQSVAGKIESKSATDTTIDSKLGTTVSAGLKTKLKGLQVQINPPV